MLNKTNWGLHYGWLCCQWELLQSLDSHSGIVFSVIWEPCGNIDSECLCIIVNRSEFSMQTQF